MNDYQEYRSYGSYLSRVFAIIIAFLLLVFAIWGIVRLASDSDDETLGDTKAPSFVDGEDREDDDDEADLFVSGDVDADDDEGDVVVVGAGDSSDDDGQTLSTNTDIAQAEAAEDGNFVAGASTDNLPETGANPTFVLALGAAAFMGSRFVLNREQ